MDTDTKQVLRKYAGKAAEELGIMDWNNDLNLIRIYRNLHILYGGDSMGMYKWIQNPNKHLENKVPANLIVTSKGEMRVLNLLEYYSQ